MIIIKKMNLINSFKEKVNISIIKAIDTERNNMLLIKTIDKIYTFSTLFTHQAWIPFDEMDISEYNKILDKEIYLQIEHDNEIEIVLDKLWFKIKIHFYEVDKEEPILTINFMVEKESIGSFMISEYHL